jgi:general secretion pathway protein J
MTFSPHQAGRRAFTLIEVLIAAVAFAMVLAAINTVFYTALRLENRSSASFDESLMLQQTLTILKRDLANIVVPGGTLCGPFQTTPTATLSGENTNSNSSLMPASTMMSAGQVSPYLYTRTAVVDEVSPFGEIQKVSYLLQASTNRSEGQDLFRSVVRNLLPSVDEQTVLQPLMTNVQSVLFDYYDGVQWRQTWDSSTADPRTGLTNAMPHAVRVQITLASEQAQRRTALPIELVVPLTVQARTNQTVQVEGQQ